MNENEKKQPKDTKKPTTKKEKQKRLVLDDNHLDKIKAGEDVWTPSAALD